MTRDALSALRGALLDRGDYPGRAIAAKVLGQDLAILPAPQPAAPQVLRHLPAALAAARDAGLAQVADSLAPLLPRLHWRQRGPSDDAAFDGGHANAVLVGTGGLAAAGPYMIGLSLAAPGVAYPLHDHPPEELYLVLSPGDFRHGDSGWAPVAPGGTFTNTPGLIHAMRAGPDRPLLALWVLGDTA